MEKNKSLTTRKSPSNTYLYILKILTERPHRARHHPEYLENIRGGTSRRPQDKTPELSEAHLLGEQARIWLAGPSRGSVFLLWCPPLPPGCDLSQREMAVVLVLSIHARSFPGSVHQETKPARDKAGRAARGTSLWCAQTVSGFRHLSGILMPVS